LLCRTKQWVLLVVPSVCLRCLAVSLLHRGLRHPHDAIPLLYPSGMQDLPLGKTLICLNVMWTHLEQRSFPMT